MLIQVNGIEMNYEISGKEKAQVVILSHSLGSSLKMWEPQMEALESHFRVLRYDTRGHGRSSTPPGPYTLELLGEDAISLLDALKVDQAHWVGLSMGGMIGQFIALNHPKRLRSLALCDTGAIIPIEAQPIWQERIVSVRQKGIESQLQGTMERWFTPSFLKLAPPMLTLIKQEFLTTPVEGYIHCSEAIRNLNTLERLREISLPTLIIVGEDDPGMPVSASEAIHQRIPHSKLVILKSARHISNVEQPEAFNTHLIDFLKSH